MPLALLLSPDDQAVSAITAVLEEMSVTCERPVDGASAAQKLNSNRFDLVLVDCENLPAAKLIFDVCRNRKGGGRPVPVAVVDGRAGLPTAFRLGAELILTKPVAKDQARITIRTALSRVKKEDSLQTEGVTTEDAQSAASPSTAEGVIGKSAELDLKSVEFQDDAADHAAPEELAFAATAASDASPTLTSFSDPVPFSSVATASTPTGSESTGSMTMSSAVVEPEVVEADSARKTDFVSSASTTSEAEETHTPASNAPRTLSQASSRAAARISAKDGAFSQTEESKASPEAKASLAAKSPLESEVKAEAKAATVISSILDREQTKVVASEQKSERSEKKQGQKSHGRLVTLVVLMLVCGGFYGAWTYEPGFQALVKSQINHLLVVLGMAPQPQQQPSPAPVKPAAQGPKPSPAVPLQTITPEAAQPAQPAATDPNAAPGATSSPALTAPPAPKTGTTAAPSPAASSPVAPSASTTPAQPVVVQVKSGVTHIQLPPNAVEHPATPAGSKSPPPQR